MIDLGTLQGTIEINGVEEASESLENVNKSASGAIDKLKNLAGALAIGATVKSAVDSVNQLNQAANKLQSQTGATDKEMTELKQTLKDIYADNFGDSFEDVADSMATVQQQTGLTGDELKSATENAMALRDTFDWDVGETIRATNMMMEQFGVTSEEAYNMIVQGAQNGLNKNDDLLDSINEYSVHFKQLGLSSEEMFNMFVNGAESGTFSVDKLGDTVKEFGIRVKDGTDDEAFKKLGLDADELKTKFVNGGEGAKQAFQQVNEALANCDDKVLQNQLGVTMYGTMWEDLGAEGVLALSNINGNIDMTKDSMNQLNQIRYDDLGSAFDGIGRQLQTGLLIPLGESLLPLLNEFANFINVNMPIIQDIASNVFSAFGDTVQMLLDHLNELIPVLSGVVAGFAAFKVITTVQGLITTFTPIITSMVAAITTAGSVTGALGAALGALASPIGIAVAAIGTLVAALVYLYNNNEEVRNFINECWEAIKQTFATVCNAIAQIVNNFVTTFNAIWKKYGSDIKEIATSAWELVKTLIKGALDFIINLGQVFSKAFQGDWQGCWEAVKKLASDIWNNITTALGQWLNLLVTTVVNVGHALFEAGKEIFTKLWEGCKNIWESLMSWLKQVIQHPIQTIKGIGSAMFEAGKSIISSLLNGLKSMWSGVESWFNDKVEWISSKLKFWEQSESKMQTSGGKANGSHRTGLETVPFDGYTAQLHKGEMVLTQAQADRYRRGQEQTVQVTQNIDTSSLERKLDTLIRVTNNIPRQQKINNNMA